MKLTRNLSVAAGITLVAATALAHSGAMGIVKERMDGMSAMAAVVQTLAPMMQGTASNDTDAVRKGTATIAAHAGEALTSKFPEGSERAPSEARPEIWQDWERFSGLSQQLKCLAKGLELAAKNSVGGMPAQVGMMGAGAPVMSAEHIGEMPAGIAFAMVSQAGNPARGKPHFPTFTCPL